jgi:myb proto-oncogene protein
MPREPWSAEEDEALRVAVALHGPTQWHLIAAKVGGGRKPTQCNARWHNYLRPGISLAPFTAAEDDTIMRGVERYGTTWRWIAAALPARTPHAIKNRWYRLDVAKKRQPSSKWTPPPILPSAASPPTLQEDERAGLAAFDPEAPRASDVGDPDPVRGAKVKEIVKEYFTSQQLHLSETHMQRLADFVYEDKLSDFVVKGRTAAFATIKIPETWRSLGLPLPKHMGTRTCRYWRAWAGSLCVLSRFPSVRPSSHSPFLQRQVRTRPHTRRPGTHRSLCSRTDTAAAPR